MKNRTISVIIILFSTVLLGIIGVQAWWIKRSFQLNKQQFDAAVYRSLESVVKQTEQKENYKFIQGNIDIDSVIRHDKAHLHKRIMLHKRRNFNLGTNGVRTSSIVSFASNSSNSKWKTVLSIENTRYGDFNTDQAVIISDNNDDQVNQAIDEATQTINQTTQAINQVDAKVGNLYSMVAKMVSIRNTDSIEVRPEDIEQLIHGEFIQNNLPDTFDFALVKGKRKYLYKSSGFTDTANTYKISLYPNDLFGRNILLLVKIPTNLQIHSSILWALSLSLLFTIVLLLLFMYSIKMLIQHKKLLAVKNDLINHMSHELKTPLAGISLGADMIMEKAGKMTTEQITKVANSIKNQSNRLNKDMSTVLLSAMVNEAPTNKFYTFNIIDTIKTAISEFELIISQRNARIETQFSNESILVLGDEMLWRKLFCNLVDNALKFSPENSLLIIKVSADKGMAHIEFKDNGMGISHEDIPHIFEKFYRSPHHRESQIQGFGLGLSFVKKVADMHGATIKVESEAGRGTSIMIDMHIQNNG